MQEYTGHRLMPWHADAAIAGDSPLEEVARPLVIVPSAPLDEESSVEVAYLRALHEMWQFVRLAQRRLEVFFSTPGEPRGGGCHPRHPLDESTVVLTQQAPRGQRL